MSGRKIIEGLEEAIAYERGDKSAGKLRQRPAATMTTDPIEAARKAYRDAHLRLERADPLVAAIAAYLRAKSDEMTRGQMTGRAQERASFLVDLAAEAERQGGAK